VIGRGCHLYPARHDRANVDSGNLLLGRSEQINRFTVPQMAYRSALFHGPIFASCNISMPFMTEE
jgi:hypothetical protein